MELTKPTMRRYDRNGVLAVDPAAFVMMFSDAPCDEASEIEGVPVVTINGPLEHHAGWWCDNYDAITQRVAKALEGPATGIVLRIDSPGGMVSGCMETARAIRAMADTAGKTITAYVDGQATSAAYALACVADSIVLPATGTVGSIGVISAMMDLTAANEAMGLRVAMVSSGARKTDGCPDVPLSADALAATQEVVDTLAGLLFEHVAAHRPALTVDAVKGLQAGLVIGARAVNLGLADAVGSLSDALALARGEVTATTAALPPEETPMATSYDEAVEALRAAAEGDGEEATTAKRMLAAMEPEEEKEPESEDPAPEPEPEKEDDTSAKAIAMRAEASAMRAERATILATRPDLSAEAKAKLNGVPVAALANVLSAIPRASATPTPPKAEAPVLGQGQGGQTTGVVFGGRVPEPNADLDRAMGLSKSTDAPIKRTATYTQFGTLTRAQADETLKKIGGAS